MPTLGANTVVPTTWSVKVRVRPPGPGTVTRTSDPMWAPTWRIVVAPSATSSSACWSRPLSVASSSRPRTVWVAIPVTVRPLMLMGSFAARLMSEMARWRAIPVSSRPNWVSPPGENARSYGCP